MAMYGTPVKLLLSLGLGVAIALGSSYGIRRRSGTAKKWDYSWGIGGLVVAAVFLLANQLIVRGIAVGIRGQTVGSRSRVIRALGPSRR